MMKSVQSGKLSISQMLFLLAWLHLLPQSAPAQLDNAQVAIALQRVEEILQELDQKAATCLEEAGGSDACHLFQQALDGQPLADYLDQCSTARRWRDDLITDRVKSDAGNTDQSDSALLLNLLVNFEYLCGQDALGRATQHTLAAYRLTRSTAAPRSLPFQPGDWQQQRLIDRERDRQQQAIDAQREQMRQQTARQLQQLELDLLRQQPAPWYRR